jgi:hypothetical protein
MKRALVVLLAALVVAGLWYAIVDRGEDSSEAAATNSAAGLLETAQPSIERIGAAESLAAPAESARSEADVTPSPEPELLTIRGIVLDQRGESVEHFGLRGVRRDAHNRFAEERTWPAEFHPGGEFTLSGLEPHVWEIAPIADGFMFERLQRFARSNERPVKFRMLCKVRVTGIVLDSEGAPVAQARVHASHTRGQRGPIVATTNESGAFALELDPGEHELLASHGLRRVSEPQSIELAPLQRPVQLEFRLALGCQLRVRFDPSWSDAILMVEPLSPREGPGLLAAKAVDGLASVCGLSPGWYRLVVRRPENSSAMYLAAVEFVQPGQVLELNFEVATPTRVALRLRVATEDVDPSELRLDYELLPTLPNLTWLEVKRDGDVGEWVRFGALPGPNSDWSGCARGSYVAMPTWLVDAKTAPVRFEVPNAVEFEVVLPRAR